MMMIMEMVMVMMTTMEMNNSNFKEKDNLRGLKKTNKQNTHNALQAPPRQ